MELERLSGVQLGELVNTKQVSPTEVINYFAERIQARNPSINAFTYTKIEDAMEEARQLEKRIQSGEYCGPFAGVPVALKDFLPSKKGWTNSHGGVKSLVAVDDADSMFYTAAKEFGAIAVGKTNAPAFGFSGACIKRCMVLLRIHLIPEERQVDLLAVPQQLLQTVSFFLGKVEMQVDLYEFPQAGAIFSASKHRWELFQVTVGQMVGQLHIHIVSMVHLQKQLKIARRCSTEWRDTIREIRSVFRSTTIRIS